MSGVKSTCGGPTTYLLVYHELALVTGLPLSGGFMAGSVGQILGEIAEDEAQNGRPMLSSLAVKVKVESSASFFELARALGKLQGSSPEVEQASLEETRRAVYEAGVATWDIRRPQPAPPELRPPSHRPASKFRLWSGNEIVRPLRTAHPAPRLRPSAPDQRPIRPLDWPIGGSADDSH